MTKRRIITWAGSIVGLLLAAAIVFLLALPHLIDSQTVKDKVRAPVSEKLGGTVTIEKINLSWFPWPVITVQGAGWAFSDYAQGSVQKIIVHPSILSLLKGRLVASRVLLEGPVVAARFPDQPDEPFSIDELEDKIRAALKILVSEFPLLGVRISDGSVRLELGGKSPILLSQFDGRIGTTGEKLEFNIAAQSDIGGQIRFAGQIGARNLESTMQLMIERLLLRDALTAFASALPEPIADGDLKLDLSFKSTGLRAFTADVNGLTPSLTLIRGSNKTTIKGKELRGRVVNDARALRVAIDHFDLTTPRLGFSGELALDRTASTVALKIAAKEADIAEIRAFVRPLVADIATLEELFRSLSAGKISQFQFETTGGSLAEMAAVKNIIAAGKIREAKVFLPALDLHLENVEGALAAAGAVVEGRNLAAKHGKVRAWDGKLRVGLGEKAPLLLDVKFEGDVREVHALLLRRIKDQATLEEMSKIRNLKGEMGGRLMLAGSLGSLVPKIIVFKANLSGSYDPIPYPITVTGGHFDYDGSAIRVKDLAAVVGRSSLSHLEGSLRNDTRPQLRIDSATLSLDVEQTHAWISRMANIEMHLDKIKSARGRVELASLSLRGPLHEPKRWDFRGTGSVKGLVVSHAQLPGPIRVAQGKFDATPARLTFSEVKGEMLDASVVMAGVVEDSIRGKLSIEGSGSGILGREMARWLHDKGEISKRLMLRSPVHFTGGRLRWSDGGDISLRGTIRVAEGPRVSVEITRSSQALAVRNLTVENGPQQAQMAFQVDSDNLNLSFRGILTQKTLDRIFATSPAQIELLQGDFRVNYFLKPPFRASALGNLEGKSLTLPLAQRPMVVDKFFVDASEGIVNIRSANLQWFGSRLSLSGSVAATKEALAVDMDLTADRVVWEDVSEIMNQTTESQGKRESARRPPIRGTARLKAESFTIDQLTWSPLHVTATFSPGDIRGRVENGIICGIRTTGLVETRNEKLNLDVRLSATDGQLESTSRCLTKQQIQGIYSLNAELAGQGDAGQLKQSLKGKFQFVARDGNLIRASGIDATFDYLNKSGDFTMEFPDLDRGAFPYRLIDVKGVIDGPTLIANEVIVQGATLSLTGEGKVDMERKQIDAKGLVSVAAPGSQVIRNLPILGALLGGSLVGIPVRVRGSLEHPDVSYLSPKDLGTELLNLPARILGLPLDAMRVFTPTSQEPKGE